MPWDYERLRDAAAHSFRVGKVTAEGLLAPVVPLAQAAEALRAIADRPEKVVKVGISY